MLGKEKGSRRFRREPPTILRCEGRIDSWPVCYTLTECQRNRDGSKCCKNTTAGQNRAFRFLLNPKKLMFYQLVSISQIGYNQGLTNRICGNQVNNYGLEAESC